MIKNILHIATPIVLGAIFYIKNVTDSTLAGLIAFFSFIACLIWGGLYDKGFFRKTEFDYFLEGIRKETKTDSKEFYFPYVYDAWKCTSILLLYILGWLVFVFFIEKKTSQNTNSENNTSVTDSSYIAPVDNATTTYQDSNSDTSTTYQNDTSSIYNNYQNENNNVLEDEYNDENIYNTTDIEVKPNFPGGIENFYKFVAKNFVVPDEEGLKGKIFVTFVVEKDGSLTDIKVIRDIGNGTGKEVVRVLESSPRWYPGEQNGKKVRVLYSLPISIQSAE